MHIHFATDSTSIDVDLVTRDHETDCEYAGHPIPAGTPVFIDDADVIVCVPCFKISLADAIDFDMTHPA